MLLLASSHANNANKTKSAKSYIKQIRQNSLRVHGSAGTINSCTFWWKIIRLNKYLKSTIFRVVKNANPLLMNCKNYGNKSFDLCLHHLLVLLTQNWRIFEHNWQRQKRKQRLQTKGRKRQRQMQLRQRKTRQHLNWINFEHN